MSEAAAPTLQPVAGRLCDRCLGRRVIGAAGEGPQREAGATLRAANAWPAVAEPECPVCEGAFADAPAWLACALQAAAPFEFAAFQVGSQFPTVCEAFERDVSKAMGQEKLGETVRTEANRWLAAQFGQATGKPATQEGRAELRLTVDTRYWTCEVEPAPLFVRGRYNKLRRDIPQTHWPCRRCQGKGCWECGDTGVTYAESVEDAIGKPALPLAQASGYSFHGAGREDIDALMLGTGRPFVLELKAPHRRSIDLAALQAAVNAATASSGVAVRDLRFAAKEEVQAIKEGEYGKEYLAHCITQAPVTREAVTAACTSLTGVTLEQRTPDRVSHRRADLVRKRVLHAVALERMEEDPSVRFSLRVHAESGTYIKEMVSGDEGRTTPSLSSVLGVAVKVDALDVLAILDDQAEAAAEVAAPVADQAASPTQ